MKTSSIKTASPFNSLFPIDNNVANAIKEHMQSYGYDESQPIILWKEKKVVVDGHTRLTIAKKIGIADIPVIEKNFSDEYEALQYALHNQRDRRNMTDADIIRIVQLVDKRKQKGERTDLGRSQPKSERSAEETAKVVGVGATKVKETRTVLDHADAQTKQKVLSGEKSIHQAYKETQAVKKHKEEQKPKSTFNETNENIEWAKWSWNPVVGCEHGCPYCYARDIAMRFYGHFKPTFFPDRLSIPANTKVPEIAKTEIGYRNVFVCSMADLFGKWVKQEWIESVVKVVRDNPQWNFLFLTKNPERYLTIEFPDNAWLGATVDCQDRVVRTLNVFREIENKIKFISCEPLNEPVDFIGFDIAKYGSDGQDIPDLGFVDWLIIGGRSKNSQMPEMQPEWAWVESLLKQARFAGCDVYFKPNLTVRPKEYPEDMT